jgi:hypothetical protein
MQGLDLTLLQGLDLTLLQGLDLTLKCFEILLKK